VRGGLVLIGIGKDHGGHYQCYDQVGNLLLSCQMTVNSTKNYKGLYILYSEKLVIKQINVCMHCPLKQG